MRREASETNKTVLELSCRWEAPTSAKQVGVLHDFIVLPKQSLCFCWVFLGIASGDNDNKSRESSGSSPRNDNQEITIDC